MHENQVLDTDYVVDRVALALQHGHTEAWKREIRQYHNRLTFSCPVCGDSADRRKRRGNMWLDTMWYTCFNCDARMSLVSFLDRFGVSVDLDVRMDVMRRATEFRRTHENTTLPENMRWAHSLKRLVKKSEQGGTRLHDMQPLRQGSRQWDYVQARRIPQDALTDIYQAEIAKPKKAGGFWYDPVVLALNRRDDELLGLQMRNLQQGQYRTFNTYNWSTLNNEFGLGAEVDPTNAARFDLLAGIFGITRIDPCKVVTVFEGYFDSLFAPNSIATMGSGRDEFVQPLIDAGLDLRFFFDNDREGARKTEKWMAKGLPCFQWKAWIDNMAKRSSNPIKIKHALLQSKDLNDLALMFQDPWTFGRMDGFFTSDALDALLL